MTKEQWLAIQARDNHPQKIEALTVTADRHALVVYVHELHVFLAKHLLEFNTLASKLEAAVDAISERESLPQPRDACMHAAHHAMGPSACPDCK